MSRGAGACRLSPSLGRMAGLDLSHWLWVAAIEGREEHSWIAMGLQPNLLLNCKVNSSDFGSL